MMGYHYYNDGLMGYWGMGFGAIFMLLWWALIIAGIVALVRWISKESHGRARTHEKSALEILKERYAKGEIGREEFEEKKKDLS